jgi:hypothetical protein
VVHSLTSCINGRAYAYEGRKEVVKKKELKSLSCGRIEGIVILCEARRFHYDGAHYIAIALQYRSESKV